MSWFKKLFTVSTNVVNEKMSDITESVVDIKREGNSLIVKLEKDINTLHGRIVEAQTDIQKSKHDIGKNDQLIHNLNCVAKGAVMQGKDTDATHALSRIEGLQTINSTHQQSINLLQPIIDQQVHHVNTMISEKQLLKAEITKLDLEEKALKMKNSLLGNNVSGSGGIDLNYLRERVNKARATVEAKEIINPQIHSDNIVEKPVVSSNVQEQLRKLKGEVA